MTVINLNQWKLNNKKPELVCPDCGSKVLETSDIADNDELILIHFCTKCDYINVSV